jgi:hypothetical protein
MSPASTEDSAASSQFKFENGNRDCRNRPLKTPRKPSGKPLPGATGSDIRKGSKFTETLIILSYEPRIADAPTIRGFAQFRFCVSINTNILTISLFIVSSSHLSVITIVFNTSQQHLKKPPCTEKATISERRKDPLCVVPSISTFFPIHHDDVRFFTRCQRCKADVSIT